MRQSLYLPVGNRQVADFVCYLVVRPRVLVASCSSPCEIRSWAPSRFFVHYPIVLLLPLVTNIVVWKLHIDAKLLQLSRRCFECLEASPCTLFILFSGSSFDASACHYQFPNARLLCEPCGRNKNKPGAFNSYGQHSWVPSRLFFHSFVVGFSFFLVRNVVVWKPSSCSFLASSLMLCSWMPNFSNCRPGALSAWTEASPCTLLFSVLWVYSACHYQLAKARPLCEPCGINKQTRFLQCVWEQRSSNRMRSHSICKNSDYDCRSWLFDPLDYQLTQRGSP